jgi:6-phosphogluconolactonase
MLLPEGSLTAFSVSPIGTLTRLSSVPSAGALPCHSSLIPSSPPRLVTTNYGGAILSSYPLLPSGDFDLDETKKEFIPLIGSSSPGPHPTRQKQDHPHGAHIDPRGRVVVVPDLGTDELRLFGIKNDGTLEVCGSIKLMPGDGPRHVLFDSARPTGPETVLYVLNELSNSVTTFVVNYPSCSSSTYPTFTLLQPNTSTLPLAPVGKQSPFSSWHAAEIKVSKDHTTLYASNRAENHDPLNGTKEGDEDVLAIFNIDPEGKLVVESKRIVTSFGRAPRHFSLSNESIAREDEGRWMALAHHDSNEVVICEIKEDGGLVEVARMGDAGRPGIVLWA